MWRTFAKNVAKTTGVVIATPIVASIGYASYQYTSTPKDQISKHHSPYSIYYQSVTNLLMSKLGSYAIKQFHSDCNQASKVNEDLLLKLLDRCKDTVYGLDYQLGDIKSRQEFKERHPITSHEHYEPYIQRIVKGEQNIMFPEQPRMIGTTSGTSGSHKLIPVPSLQRKVFFTKGITVTFDALQNGIKHKTNAKLKWPNLQKSCKLMHEPNFTYTKHGIKVGPNSSSPKDNKGLLQLYTTPAIAFDVHNENELLYIHALYALLDKNLGFIEANFANRVWNFFALLDDQWDSLIETIETGQLPSGLIMDERIQKELNEKLKSNQDRAMELRCIKKEHNMVTKNNDDADNVSVSLARKIWPNLHTILASETGTFQIYGQKLREQFIGDDITIYSPLYAATEGLIGVNPHIENQTFVLHPGAMFYEFYPIEHEDEYEDKDKHDRTQLNEYPYQDKIDSDKTLFIEQLEPGIEYEIIITNLTGLYRYRFGDVIRCVGYENEGEAPTVEFAYRKGQFLNASGERTSEETFYKALSSTVANDWKLSLKEYTTVEYFLQGNVNGKPRYVVYVELNKNDGTNTASVERSLTKKEKKQLDEALGKENKSYKALRTNGRLYPIEVIVVRNGTFEKLRQEMISAGIGPTQVKQPRVTRNEMLIKTLEEGACV